VAKRYRESEDGLNRMLRRDDGKASARATVFAKPKAQPGRDAAPERLGLDPGPLLAGFVFERELELGAVGDRAALVEVYVLLHDLGYPEVADSF
jgi:hypothetical protein